MQRPNTSGRYSIELRSARRAQTSCCVDRLSTGGHVLFAQRFVLVVLRAASRLQTMNRCERAPKHVEAALKAANAWRHETGEPWACRGRAQLFLLRYWAGNESFR